MPKASVVILTHNRPELLRRAIKSVLAQTYKDFEIIVVDNGMEVPAEKIVKSFKDKRIRYIRNKRNLDCAGGKNVGIKNARGELVAFLDDDDVWLSEKLEIQINELDKAPKDVGFCFTAAIDVLDDREEVGRVPGGVANYYERALRKFNGFLAVTLIIKKSVFGYVGVFDEKFPSHTDIDLVIRIAKKYKGTGINKPLVKVTRLSTHNQMGKDLARRIKGREMILKKYYSEFKRRPKILAMHYFQLALFYRDDKQYKQAGKVFKKAWKTHFRLRRFLHYLSMVSNGRIYRIFRSQ